MTAPPIDVPLALGGGWRHGRETVPQRATVPQYRGSLDQLAQ